MTPLRSAEAVGDDRPCPRCGYNLRGLPVPGRCPECGEAIRRPRAFSRFTDTLADAPFFYLRPLAVGLGLMAAASVGGAVALGYSRGPWRYYGSAWAVVFALAWWGGAWLVTRPRAVTTGTVPDGILDSPAFRASIRLSQTVWLAAAAGWAIAAFAPLLAASAAPIPGAAPAVVGPLPAEALGRRLAITGEVVGLLSLVPLSVFLSGLAAWAGDDPLAERCRIAAWGMAGGGVIGIVCTLIGNLAWPPAGLFRIVGVFAWAGALLAQLLVVADLVQLAWIALWAISNAHTRSQVEARLARKQARYERQLADKAAAAGAAVLRAPPLSFPSGADRPPEGNAFEGRVVERPAGGAAPYPVEPPPPAA